MHAIRYGGLLVLALLAGLAILAIFTSSHAEAAAPGAPPAGYEKPSAEVLKRTLTPLQFEVTQEEGTEPPFHNEFWDNHAPGIYVDVVSGEPLFSSLDKFDSGTGWPSFTKPLEPQNIVTRTDRKLLMSRTEVRSRLADSHLGHIFDDGPPPTGKRYCMNSAALRFVPADKLAQEGYGQYAKLFAKGDAQQQKLEKATLAGGCFWGMEEFFRKLPGVTDIVVGYTGGTRANPDYEEVSSGATGHAESVEITFDPAKISFSQILGLFFRMHDPTTLDRQGNDVGTQYRSAIFVHSDEQRRIAEQVRDEVNRSGKWKQPVVTQIVPAGPFYRAEEYHQDYLVKHPGGYDNHYLRE